MVGELDPNRKRGALDASGHFVVGEAGSRIARGVIMNDDDGVGSMADRLPENLGGVGKGLVAGAAENFGEMDEPLAVIEEDHPDRFLREHLHFGTDEGKDIFGGRDGEFVERFVRKAAPEFEDGGELCRLGGADPRDLTEFPGSGAGKVA